jgi:hypothetical protein
MWFCPVNRMSFCPGLLLVTLNLALIIQDLSRFFFSILHTPEDVFAYHRGYAYPRLKTTELECNAMLIRRNTSTFPKMFLVCPQD